MARWIAGSATLTMVPSTKAIPDPTMAATSVHRRAASLHCVASSPAASLEGWGSLRAIVAA
jgi:hypothetical protein